MVYTIGELANAIRNKLDLGSREAQEMAESVLRYFGYENLIVDNGIESSDRRYFYKLHDAGLLKTKVDSILLSTGKRWRIFYWELNSRAIEKALGTRTEEDEFHYRALPDDHWLSTNASST